MSPVQDNVPADSLSGLHSSSEAPHSRSRTPETEEDDQAKSITSEPEEADEDDEESEGSDDDEEGEESDDASVASYDSDFPDQYITHDHEARYTESEALEKGPSSINFPEVSTALTTRNQNNYRSLPDLVKLEIATLVLLPMNQRIRIIWNHDDRVWTYRGNDIPFVQFGFPGLRAAAKNFLDRAPLLNSREYNLLVHYPTADFNFQYKRCGSRTEDDDEYLEAIQDAARTVASHNSQTAKPKIKSLTLSWCPRHDDPSEVLQHFQSIPGLEKVDLKTHNHYRRGPHIEYNLRNEEEDNDKWHVENSLQSYPFKVEMYNHWGVQIEADEDEDKDDEEDEW